MADLVKRTTAEGEIEERLDTVVSERLHADRPWCGLRWSPRMPEDDPNSPLLVIDADGTEYELEIDVQLWVVGPPTPIESLKLPDEADEGPLSGQ